jgi:hypothetical protein
VRAFEGHSCEYIDCIYISVDSTLLASGARRFEILKLEGAFQKLEGAFQKLEVWTSDTSTGMDSTFRVQ